MDSRTRVIRVVVIVVALLAAAGGLMWWEAGRPGQVRVVPDPPTATVRIGEHQSQGVLDVTLPPGRYTVHMRAPGHLPLDLELEVQARTQLELTPRLLPIRRRAP